MADCSSAERARKRCAADDNSPLHDEGILQVIVDLVGPGEHAFVSAVSKHFRARIRVCSQQAAVAFG
jgi:hypothetical protein